MARKSRKNADLQRECNPHPLYNAAGYIRLSVTSDDSPPSVETQKMIIEEWVKHQEDVELKKFYIDVNKTGQTFERKAYKEMLGDVENGKINCVVVKDLSRLGRDLVGTGFYIENFFPTKKVRFVSVNDRFDTLNGISNISFEQGPLVRIPILNAFNEALAKDMRDKTQEALNFKMQKGMFVGPKAPFGYEKSSQDNFKLIPDLQAASTVRKIFDLVINGMGVTAIVRYLNENKIQTPMEYARSKGLSGNYNDGTGDWNSRSVKYILRNRAYIGILEQGDSKYVIENAHEPLVDKAIFERIQKQLNQKAYFASSDNTGTENILKSKVICGDCGSKMQRKKGNQNGDWHFFICHTNNRVGADRCSGMYIREDEIFKAIYHQLKVFLKTNAISLLQYRSEKEKRQLAVELCEQNLDHAYDVLKGYYEQMVSKKISKEEYLSHRPAKDEVEQLMTEITAELETFEKEHQKQLHLVAISEKATPLSALMDYIEKITINTGRKVEVHFGAIYSVLLDPPS